MENAIQIFTNEEFGSFRTLKINDKDYFVGKDIAKILGYEKTANAIAVHVDEEDKGVCKIGTPGGMQEMTIINESGLYSLILSSKLPTAKKFKHWITSEVLPSIRKTGSYSVRNLKAMYPLEAVTQVTDIAAKIQESFSVKKGIALAQAISIVEPVYGSTLEPLRQILPPADHETGFMNATKLGEKLGGLSSQKVNQLLADAKLQYKDGKNWRITESGAKYGEEMPYKKNGHSGYQIRWNEKILKVFPEKSAS